MADVKLAEPEKNKGWKMADQKKSRPRNRDMKCGPKMADLSSTNTRYFNKAVKLIKNCITQFVTVNYN